METTEKIVEAYCRYVKGWFTITNVKCAGQHEIDILAVDPSSKECCRRYHIECGISISGSHSKLTAQEFSEDRLKQRVEKSRQRRTIGYFIQRKFDPPKVISELVNYGFLKSEYTRVIVTWGWTPEAEVEADSSGIVLWDFRNILNQIAETCRGNRTYFTDDTLRTIQLFVRSYKL